MKRIWLVTNAASGTFSKPRLEALEAQLERLGVVVVETSDFPRSDLPTPEALDAAEIDTLALFAGDGSIGAAVRHSQGWAGDVLVLPGGTMNLLAKRLHGDRDVEAIVDAVKDGGARSAPISGARVGDRLALVGIIAGPVTAWAQAREHVREGALTSLPGSIVEAVRETVAGEGVRVAGLGEAQRAVFVFPEPELLEAIAPAPGSIGEVAQLGWDLAAGDWRTSPGSARIEGGTIFIEHPAELRLLVDGEPLDVTAPLSIVHAMTSQSFHASIEDRP